MGTLFRRQSVLSSSPNRNLVDDSCHLRSLPSAATFGATIEHPAHTTFFAHVGWPNIGLVAAGPARPAPTALLMCVVLLPSC